jgi:hypothetical protein
MSLWRVAWLTCMQNVGALRMLGNWSTSCHLKMWSLRLSLGHMKWGQEQKAVDLLRQKQQESAGAQILLLL